jgi:ribose/xylose/arabinose/galactoside ABC-type transport system permease subunit
LKIDFQRRLKAIYFLIGPFIGLAFVYLLFCFLAPEQFRSWYNTKTILNQAVIFGIGALGMTFIIISGGIDLSVGSQIALGTVVVATILKTWGGDLTPLLPLPDFIVSTLAHFGGPSLVAFIQQSIPALLAALAAIGVCALCGLLNGLMISKLRIVPFIITLGMMQIVRGVAKWIGKEQTVTAPSTWLNSLMDIDPQQKWLLVSPGVWTMLLLLILMFIVLRYTVFGRYVFAIGSNEATARLCGININLNRIWIYTLASALTGVAAVMQFSMLTVGDPTGAEGSELNIIAAVVIGGGSLNGGEGSAIGSLMGALLMAVLQNGCNMLGIPNYVQNIVIGGIIISAVGIDRLKHRGQ